MNSITENHKTENQKKGRLRLFRFPVEVEVVKMKEAAEVLRVAVFLLIRPPVNNFWGFFGFRVLIVLEMLLLADDTAEVISVCLCLIMTPPRYFPLIPLSEMLSFHQSFFRMGEGVAAPISIRMFRLLSRILQYHCFARTSRASGFCITVVVGDVRVTVLPGGMVSHSPIRCFLELLVTFWGHFYFEGRLRS